MRDDIGASPGGPSRPPGLQRSVAVPTPYSAAGLSSCNSGDTFRSAKSTNHGVGLVLRYGSASAHSLDPFKDQRCGHLRIILTSNNPSFAEPHVDPIQHPEQGHGNGHQERTLRLIEIWLYLPQYS